MAEPEPPTVGSGRRKAAPNPYLFGAVGVLLVAAAVVLLVTQRDIPPTIAAMIGLGCLIILFPHLPPFKLGVGDFSFETLQNQVANLQQDMAGPRAGRTLLQQFAATGPEELRSPGPFEGDTQKGKFGGSPEANGRRLEASVTRTGTTDWATVEVRVWSTAGRPLAGTVEFHLHETFKPEDVQTVPVNAAGIARLEFPCWGAFTVGAVADSGATRLELDLKDAPGSFAPWKDR